MAYLTIKKVNGCFYGYMQESYREGGKVRTRTVEYLGAIEPAVAKQLQSTRKQLGQVDMAALVQSVRQASQAVTSNPKHATAENGVPEAPKESLITTDKIKEVTKPKTSDFHYPANIQTYQVNETSLRRTHQRFGDRLTTMGVDPSSMPKVEMRFGHPDGMQRLKDGSYLVTVSRKPHNKRHQINKTKLWEHTRQALSMAYLDALSIERPDIHHALQSELDTSHKETKRILINSLSAASGSMEKFSLSLQLYVWNSVPQALVKRQVAEEFGQASFATLKDWRSEAAFVLSQAHKSGWSGLEDRQKKTRRKLKTSITKRRNQIDRMGMMERMSARLSGKRRRLIREIMAEEQKLQALDKLTSRVKLLKKHFPL